MTARRITRPLRTLSAVVLVGLLIVSASVSLVVRSGVADEQQRLLVERTAEAGSLISEVFNQSLSALQTLSALAPVRPGSSPQFAAAARSDLGLVGTIGVLGRSPNGFTVLESVGTGSSAGTAAALDRVALARETLASHSIATAVVHTSSGPRLSFALASPSGLVVYEDMSFDSKQPISEGPNEPFNELNGAVYASAQADPSDLVITTTAHLPPPGR